MPMLKRAMRNDMIFPIPIASHLTAPFAIDSHLWSSLLIADLQTAEHPKRISHVPDIGLQNLNDGIILTMVHFIRLPKALSQISVHAETAN